MGWLRPFTGVCSDVESGRVLGSASGVPGHPVAYTWLLVAFGAWFGAQSWPEIALPAALITHNLFRFGQWVWCKVNRRPAAFALEPWMEARAPMALQIFCMLPLGAIGVAALGVFLGLVGWWIVSGHPELAALTIAASLAAGVGAMLIQRLLLRGRERPKQRFRDVSNKIAAEGAPFWLLGVGSAVGLAVRVGLQ
jgi:hypothetical protein